VYLDFYVFLWWGVERLFLGMEGGIVVDSVV